MYVEQELGPFQLARVLKDLPGAVSLQSSKMEHLRAAHLPSHRASPRVCCSLLLQGCRAHALLAPPDPCARPPQQEDLRRQLAPPAVILLADQPNKSKKRAGAALRNYCVALEGQAQEEAEWCVRGGGQGAGPLPSCCGELRIPLQGLCEQSSSGQLTAGAAAPAQHSAGGGAVHEIKEEGPSCLPASFKTPPAAAGTPTLS